MLKNKLLYSGLILAALACATPARAEVATLVSPPANGMLPVDGNISFTIHDGAIPPERLNNVFVQFDGDDVTSLVAMNGLTVTYDPPQRLAFGEHRLLLVEKQADGTFKGLQTWTFRVGGGGIAGTTVEGTFQGQYKYLLADNLEGNDKIHPHSGNAAVTATATSGGQTWDSSATFNGFFDSHEENNEPDQDHFELGEYLLSLHHQGEDVNTLLRAGNHDTGISNLLVDQYVRRGASAHFDIGNYAAFTGFAQDPAVAIGNGNVTGFLRDDQRAQGAVARAYMFPDSYGKRLFAEAGFYDGEGAQQGDGTVPASNPTQEGHGWVAALEGQTQNDKANIRGEFSEAHFDEDGSGAVVADNTEAAWRGRLQFAPIASLNPEDGATKKWLLQALYQRIGTFYRALTNAGLPQDEHRMTLTSNYLQDTLNWTLEGYYVQNNVDDIGNIPTDHGRGALTQLTVTPAWFDSSITPESFLGRSTFNAGASVSRETRLDTPAGFLGDGLFQTTWTANAGWAVAYDKFSVSLGNTWSEFDNEAVGLNSYRSDFTELAVNWTPTDRLTVTPSAQVQLTKDKIQHSTQQYFANLDTSYIIIPDKLTNTFHYSAVFDDGTAADNQHIVSTEFVYKLNEATRNSPGFSIGLSGDYERGVPSSLPVVPPVPGPVEDENYKIYLSLKISAPFGF
jgi:hypothetical protein